MAPAQRSSTHTPKPDPEVENSVLARAVILAALLLGGLFVGLLFLENNLSKIFGKYASEAVTGLMLLSLWLVTVSALRAVHRLAKDVPNWKLLLSGTLTGLIGTVLTVAFLTAFPDISKSDNMQQVAGAAGALILLMTAMAFISSVLALIRLRMKNKPLGKVLELLIVVACFLGFLYLVLR